MSLSLLLLVVDCCCCCSVLAKDWGGKICGVVVLAIPAAVPVMGVSPSLPSDSAAAAAVRRRCSSICIIAS